MSRRAVFVCVLAACSVAPVTFTPLGGPVEPPEPTKPGDAGVPGTPEDAGVPSGADAPIGVDAAVDIDAAPPAPPACGDGHVDPGEACDGGGTATATCNADCTMAACGDGKLNMAAGEQCDNGSQATATCDIDCTLPRCGDGLLNTAAGEEVDSPMSPSPTVPVNDQTCRFDFSAITQLFCNGSCGTWGGGNGCQQQDADALCKLRTGNRNSVATNFASVPALPAPGICCPSVDPASLGCTPLGSFADRGVTQPVSIDEADLSASHGRGQVVANVECTNP